MKVREEFLKETAVTTSSVTFRVFSGQFFNSLSLEFLTFRKVQAQT